MKMRTRILIPLLVVLAVAVGGCGAHGDPDELSEDIDWSTATFSYEPTAAEKAKAETAKAEYAAIVERWNTGSVELRAEICEYFRTGYSMDQIAASYGVALTESEASWEDVLIRTCYHHAPPAK